MDNILIQFAKLFPTIDAAIASGIVVFSRMLGFIFLAPIFSRKEIPPLVKIGFTLLLTAALMSVLKSGPPPADNSIVLSILLNFTVGAIIGYMARLILIAIEAGADMINMQMGLSSAMVLDPSTQRQVSIMEKFFGILGIIIFIQIGGIYWLFQAFIRSFELFPIYAVSIPLAKIVNMEYLIKMTSNVLYMGLQIASPILLATLGQDIILGIISKTAPQVNVFQLSFLFKPVFGAAIIIWVLPMLVNIISDYFLSFAHIF